MTNLMTNLDKLGKSTNTSIHEHTVLKLIMPNNTIDNHNMSTVYTLQIIYSKAKLPVKIPPEVKPVSLFNLQREENSVTFLEQALGSVVTKGLREIGETRLKYPTLSVKETMLKLFAIFLKTENPANSEFMKQKYRKKMEDFLEKCTVPEELNDLAKKKQKGKWPQFKENYYN